MNTDSIVSAIWNIILSALEVTKEILSAAMILVGVLAANLADVIMGAIAASILFGGVDSVFYGYKSTQIAMALSLATTAIQLILWNYIRNRGFRFSEIFSFKKLSSDIRAFLVFSLIIWFGDTLMDVSPVFLMVRNSGFQEIPSINKWVLGVVLGLFFIICGFSEPLTANISTLIGSRKIGDARTRYSGANKGVSQFSPNGGGTSPFGKKGGNSNTNKGRKPSENIPNPARHLNPNTQVSLGGVPANRGVEPTYHPIGEAKVGGESAYRPDPTAQRLRSILDSNESFDFGE